MKSYIDQIIAAIVAIAFGVIWALRGGQLPETVTLLAAGWLFRGGGAAIVAGIKKMRKGK